MSRRLPIPDRVRREHVRQRRLRHVAALRERGYTLREIAAHLGISITRVHQLLAEVKP